MGVKKKLVIASTGLGERKQASAVRNGFIVAVALLSIGAFLAFLFLSRVSSNHPRRTVCLRTSLSELSL